jgi:hypothetical protein
MFSHLLENIVHENIREKVTVCDIYELDPTVIGSGSYGSVCVATHRRTGQKFACKKLKLSRCTPR